MLRVRGTSKYEEAIIIYSGEQVMRRGKGKRKIKRGITGSPGVLFLNLYRC